MDGLTDEEYFANAIQVQGGGDTIMKGNKFRTGFTSVDKLDAVERLLEIYMGGFENIPNDMKDTPRRFVAMLDEMTTPEPFNFTVFDSDANDIVILDPIPFYTLCAHHLVPFFGHAFIGYVPDGKIAGLSKFVRAVQGCSKGFHVQEELTRDLADYLEEKLAPRGVAVVMRAEHLCMAMRGAKTAGVKTTTSRMTGVFADHDRTAKAEFMQIIQSGGGW